MSPVANTTPAPPTPSGGSRLVTNPWLGIVGVFLGAGVATLNGRLLTVGLPDLRGAMGFGFDEASWLPTALNMAMMFSGCFVVFLSSWFGPVAFCFRALRYSRPLLRCYRSRRTTTPC